MARASRVTISNDSDDRLLEVYHEGDITSVINGLAFLAEGPSNTLMPPQLDASGYLKVNVVAGGAGGGLAQTQVVDSAGTWTNVGYATGNLNMPVQVEQALPTGSNIIGKVKLVDPSGDEPEWADTANNAIRVNVVAGGAGGGVAQAQVRDSSNNWVDVGYYTGNLNMPVDIQSSIALPVTDNGGTISIDDGAGSITIDGSVSIGAALPAGTNNIGDVDVLTLPAITIAAAQTLDTVNTITNVVHIDDNGGSLTVDGTIAATQSGVWSVTADTELTTDDLDTGTGIDTQAIMGIALPGAGGHTLWDGTVVLGAGSAAIGSVDVTSLPVLPAGTNTIGSVKITDGTDTALVTTGGLLQVDASGVAVPITDNGGSLTIDGTVGISGTVTVDSELGTDDLDTGTGVDTQAITGIALPGVGGHTLWDGTVILGAGSASIGVLGANSGVDIGDVTINNGTGAAAVNIQDGGNSITVDATALDIRALTASDIVTVDQLKTDDFDTGTGVDTQSIVGIVLPAAAGHTLWDGTVVLGAGANAIGSVDVTSLPAITIAASQTLDTVNTITNVVHIDDNAGSITVDGSVSLAAAIPAGTNNIGDVDVVTQPARVATTDSVTAKLATDALQDGLTAVTPKFATINAATAGDNTIVSAVTGKKIRVLQYTLVCAAATDIKWQSGAGTAAVALSGLMSIAANSGLSTAFSPVGLFETAAGSALTLNLSAANQTSGTLVYVEI